MRASAPSTTSSDKEDVAVVPQRASRVPQGIVENGAVPRGTSLRYGAGSPDREFVAPSETRTSAPTSSDKGNATAVPHRASREPQRQSVAGSDKENVVVTPRGGHHDGGPTVMGNRDQPPRSIPSSRAVASSNLAAVARVSPSANGASGDREVPRTAHRLPSRSAGADEERARIAQSFSRSLASFDRENDAASLRRRSQGSAPSDEKEVTPESVVSATPP
jgi:hypothetical protein